LPPVDLCQDSGNSDTVIRWIDLHFPQLSPVLLEPGDPFQSWP
jgi:hypothetical protein